MRQVGDFEALASLPIRSQFLWGRTPDGEPEGITLTYLLEIIPQNPEKKPVRIARTLLLRWASCL